MKEHEYLVRIYNKGGLADEYTVYDWGECQDVLWNTLYGEEDGHYAKIYEDGRYIGKVTPSMMVKENKGNTNTNMNKKTIRLTESDLHRIVKESVGKIINEMDDDYPHWQDDEGNIHTGHYWHKTNNFKRGNILWLLSTKNIPGEVFLSPQDAAEYAAAEWLDANRENTYDEDIETLPQIMMKNFTEVNGWTWNIYSCEPVQFVRRKQ